MDLMNEINSLAGGESSNYVPTEHSSARASTTAALAHLMNEADNPANREESRSDAENWDRQTDGTHALDSTHPLETPKEAPTEAKEAPEEQATDDEAAEEQKRLARLARENRKLKREKQQLELQNQALSGQREETHDEAFQRAVQQEAAKIAQTKTVNQKADDTYAEGVKAYGRNEFNESVASLQEAFGQRFSLVVETLVDLQDTHKLIQHLADNPDILDDIAALPPHRMGAALAKEAVKVSTPKPKPVSKAPAPAKTITQTSVAEADSSHPEKMSGKQFDKWLLDSLAAKRRW